ncbi:LysM peptidoglycan-binding domain-containing protein [Virgibacillus sediminis]|uniref:Autolysin n=1 Tax=Virgibacillus sediminis TaxID=202260 RepID=A0ABV7A6K3_9BACI
MAYKFERLPQLVDKRNSLRTNGRYSNRRQSIRTRTWHHSLTRKHLGGSDAASFAKFHVETHGWPGCGYAIVIEPKNIVNTPNGKRARIVYANSINKRTYHAGNSNDYSLGICVAGDYRYDEMDEPTLASIDELQAALVADGIGREDKSHNEMPGYNWKACCEYNYMQAFKFLDGDIKQAPIPDTYTIQEGDTLWSVANGLKDVNLDDLMAANPDVDPTKLNIGQTINLGKAKKASAPKRQTKSSTIKSAGLVVDGYWGALTTRALQESLGTPVDGVISNQYRNIVTIKITSGITFSHGGSTVIRALQRKIRAKADGYLGQETVTKLQQYLGTPVDGIISSPSTMVKELQRRLSLGTF